MRIYLSGPMTGIKNFNYDAFNEAAATLRALGHFVVNPAEHFGGAQDRKFEEYLRADVQDILAKCDTLVVLPGWESSRGSRFEAHLCRILGFPAYSYHKPGIGNILRNCTESVDRAVLRIPGLMDEGQKQAQQERMKTLASGDEIESRITTDKHLGELRSSYAALASAQNVPGVKSRYGPLPVGYKESMDNPAKLPLGLIPRSMFDALGRSLGHGARKYAAHNYRAGMAWSEPYSAILRHLTAWADGEDIDADSGNGHLDNAAAMLAFLIEYVAHPELYSKFDDRFVRPSAGLGLFEPGKAA